MKEYKFKIGGKEYNVTVNPKEGKFFDVTVNGATYEVEAENAPAAAPVAQPVAAPVQAAAAAPAAPAAKPAGVGEKLASPLPGVIIAGRNDCLVPPWSTSSNPFPSSGSIPVSPIARGRTW